MSKYELQAFKKAIKNGGRRSTDNLKSVAMIASLGNIFANTQQGQNDWKVRMLKAGLENKGLIMPEDWNTLDEKTKEERLDGAIAILK